MALTSEVLPAPDRPKRATSPPPRGEAGIEQESAQAMLDVDGERHSTSSRRLARRAISSDASRRQHGDGDRDEGQAQRAHVAARHLREGVDGRGQRLRLAGDVGDEGDGGAELAHGLGEAQDHAGDDARHDQRQRHGGEYPGAIGAERAGGLLEPRVYGLDRQADGAHQQREAHDAAGERRASPAKREDDAEMVGQEGADRPSPSEQDQQDVAGDDGRQDQRHEHEAVEQGVAPEPAPRQHHGDGDAERQADQGGDGRDLRLSRNRRPFLRAEGHPVHARIASARCADSIVVRTAPGRAR